MFYNSYVIKSNERWCGKRKKGTRGNVEGLKSDDVGDVPQRI